MSINKFNSEGYYDPTAYEALTAIEKKKRHFEPFVLLYISALLIPEMLRQMSPQHRNTAALLWITATFPSHRTCFFRSFSTMMIPKSISLGCSLVTR